MKTLLDRQINNLLEDAARYENRAKQADERADAERRDADAARDAAKECRQLAYKMGSLR